MGKLVGFKKSKLKKFKLNFYYFLFFLLLLNGSILFLDKVFYWSGIQDKFGFDVLHLLQTLPLIGGTFCVFFVVKQLRKVNLMESIHYIGFKSINLKHLFVGLCLALPIALGTFLTLEKYKEQGIQFSLRTDWLSYSFYLLVCAGFFEEAINRGFVFQILRETKSFVSAAFLSGLFWSLFHLDAYVYNPNETNIKIIIVTMIWTVILSFPSAYVFERTGNVIWVWMMVHLSIDVIYLVDLGDDLAVNKFNMDNIFQTSSIFLSAIITFPVVDFFFSPRRKNKSKRRKYG